MKEATRKSGSRGLLPRRALFALSVVVFAALAIGVSACGSSNSSSNNTESSSGEEASSGASLAVFEKKLKSAEETEPSHW